MIASSGRGTPCVFRREAMIKPRAAPTVATPVDFLLGSLSFSAISFPYKKAAACRERRGDLLRPTRLMPKFGLWFSVYTLIIPHFL